MNIKLTNPRKELMKKEFWDKVKLVLNSIELEILELRFIQMMSILELKRYINLSTKEETQCVINRILRKLELALNPKESKEEEAEVLDPNDSPEFREAMDACLTEREKYVFEKYYFSEEKVRMEDIAAEFAISKMAISKTLKKARKKLHKYLESS